jgi:hypothetical protein
MPTVRVPLPLAPEVTDGVLRLHNQADKIGRAHNWAGVIATPGAGEHLEHWLRGQSGCSRTLLNSHSLYGNSASAEYLGYVPRPVVTEAVTVEMAARLYEEANRHADSGRLGCQLFGLAINGSIYTDQERHGPDQAFIALKCSTGTFVTHIVFNKEPGKYCIVPREEQDQWCTIVALNLLLTVSGLKTIPLPSWNALVEEFVVTLRTSSTPLKDIITISPIRRILGECEAMDHVLEQPVFHGHGGRSLIEGTISAGSHALIPSAVDLLSPAHNAMALWARRELDLEPIFNLEIAHPVKPTLDLAMVNQRLLDMVGLWSVVVTDGASKFVDKAKAFPGVPVLMGADAFHLMLKQAYNAGSYNGVRDTLQAFADCGTKIHVFSRVLENGRVLTADDVLTHSIGVPHFIYMEVVSPVNSLIKLPGVDWSTSSTELRRRRAQRIIDVS